MPTDSPIPPDLSGQTVAAALAILWPQLSWSQAKRLITSRRVAVNGTICLNDARRLNAGEVVTVLDDSGPPVPRERDVRLLHIDPDLIVLEKPAGIVTLRRDEEKGFSDQRKDQQPSLDEVLPRLLPARIQSSRSRQSRNPKSEIRNPQFKFPLYAVHRLDRDTSGLMLFALSTRGRDALIRLFSRHHVNRTYLAVVHGRIDRPLTLDTYLIRDRGDGLRGSSPQRAEASGAQRITHVEPLEHFADAYTLIRCRLETGRTHQIRIHLSEIGHRLCGEKLYARPSIGAAPLEDPSNAPRQALHSADLEFTHPITQQQMHFTSPLPNDLSQWIQRLHAAQR